MINPFKPFDTDAPENRDIGFRYNRYRHYLRRARRREKRRNRSLLIMVPVMAAALLISLYHTFAPKRQPRPVAESVNASLPAGFLKTLDNASVRLDSILRVYLPDDTLSARQMQEQLDSLDPLFDIFQGEPGLSTLLYMLSGIAEPASVREDAFDREQSSAGKRTLAGERKGKQSEKR